MRLTEQGTVTCCAVLLNFFLPLSCDRFSRQLPGAYALGLLFSKVMHLPSLQIFSTGVTSIPWTRVYVTCRSPRNGFKEKCDETVRDAPRSSGRRPSIERPRRPVQGSASANRPRLRRSEDRVGAKLIRSRFMEVSRTPV